LSLEKQDKMLKEVPFFVSGHHSHVQDAAAEVDLRADEEPRGVGDADVHNDLAAKDRLNVSNVDDDNNN